MRDILMIQWEERLKKRYWLVTILIASLSTKLIYLFFFSNYRAHLTMDMLHYWNRGLTHFQGDMFSEGLWDFQPPYFPLYLSWIFKFTSAFHLSSYNLEIVLLLNIVYSTISIYFLHQIAFWISGNRLLAILASMLYAFSYPVIYFDTLVLSESMGSFFLITSVFLLFLPRQRLLTICFAGIIFALAVSMRPNLGLIGLPLFVYLVLTNSSSNFRMHFRAGVFVCGFLLILSVFIVESRYLSKGRVQGLVSNGGSNFFVSQCKPYKIEAGKGVWLIHPSVMPHPEFGIFRTEHRLSDQSYFFKRGLECMGSIPGFWKEHFAFVIHTVISGNVFPDFTDIRGHKILMGIFTLGTSLCFLTLPLFLYFSRDKKLVPAMTFALSTIPIFIFLTSCFFGIEHRYFLPSLFVLYLSFAAVFVYGGKHKKMIFVYLLTGGFIFGACYGINSMERRKAQKIYHVNRIRTFPLEMAKRKKNNGTLWNEWGNFIIPEDSALLFKSSEHIEAQEVRISADHNDIYQIDFYSDGQYLATLIVPVVPSPSGLQERTLRLPEEMKEKAFNQVLVQPREGDGRYSVGHVLFRK